ncbi:MAG: flagellar hook-basal body complex protein FliE [Gammaproteobacteria bacterium]|nr:flagellar hook-basal body complex protein FliE [Gammaproteobacteria bacterium]
MSNMEINRVLAQMRTINTELQPAKQTEEVAGANFSESLKQAANQVSELQNNASNMVSQFETGATDVSLAEVMVSMQKASLSFQAMTEVRNKLIDAYKEVMNMPI